MPRSAAGGSVERRRLLSPSGAVRVDSEGDDSAVTISLAGNLDGVAGAALVDAVRAELNRGPTRIDVDLGPLVSFTEEGAAALATVRELSTGLADGLHYRTEGGAGGEAVLAAFDREQPFEG